MVFGFYARPSLTESFLKPENERFRFSNCKTNGPPLWARKWGFAGPFFSAIILETVFIRKWSPIFGQHGRPKLASGMLHRHGFPHIVGGTSVQMCRKQQYETHLSAKQAAVSTARCAPLPTRARLRHHHEPMGSDRDGIDYESLATLLAVAIAAFSKRNQKLVSSRTRAVTA